MDLFKPNVQKMREKKDVRGLIKALGYKDPEVRAMACRALGNLGDKSAVEPLVAALKDKDEQVRRDAAAALGWLGDPRAADALLAVLPEKSMFSAAAQSLARLKEPRLFDRLIAALQDDTVCSPVANALGELGDPRAVEPLIDLLHRQDAQIRRSAAFALLKLRDPRAARDLEAALKDSDATVRRVAVDALNGLPDGLKKETLLELLHDPDIKVREEAGFYLAKMGVPDDPIERAWFAAARREWEMAFQLGQIAVEPLVLATQTEDIEHQLGAAKTLARLGDRRAVEPLLSCLVYALAKPKVYEEAAETLGKYGDRRAVKPLQDRLQSFEPKVRAVAFRALNELESRLNRISSTQPVCFCCGESIPALKGTIADDIRRGGGTAIGAELEQKLFEGVICRTCGRVFCMKCHNPGEKGYDCPVCKHELSPLFASYLIG